MTPGNFSTIDRCYDDSSTVEEEVVVELLREFTPVGHR
jgi:hypothetical protein